MAAKEKTRKSYTPDAKWPIGGAVDTNRMTELVIRGLGRWLPPEDHLRPEQVVAELAAREALVRRDLISFLHGHGKIFGADWPKFETRELRLTNYAQLMRQVAEWMTPALAELVRRDIRNRPFSQPFKEENTRRFSQAMHYLTRLRESEVGGELARMIGAAEQREIRISLWRRSPENAAATLYAPGIAITKSKTLESGLEKVIRRLIQRTRPENPVINREMLSDVNANDWYGVKLSWLTEYSVLHAETSIHHAHLQGKLEIAYKHRGSRAHRSYLNEDSIKENRWYRAAHINVYPPSARLSVAEPIELQLLPADSLVIELFDPMASHLTYKERKITRATTEALMMRDGKTRKVKWSKQQNGLFYDLIADAESRYGIGGK